MAKPKTLKRLTQSLKALRGLTRVPAALPLPGSEAYRYPKVIDGKDHKATQARMKDFEAADATRLDKAVIKYWAEEATDDNPRKR